MTGVSSSVAPQEVTEAVARVLADQADDSPWADYLSEANEILDAAWPVAFSVIAAAERDRIRQLVKERVLAQHDMRSAPWWAERFDGWLSDLPGSTP